jgi:cell division transport system permease protein
MKPSHIVQEAWRSVSRNRGGFALAATVQGICLILLSLFLVITLGVVQLSEMAGRRIELYVFLDDNASEKTLEGRIGLIEGVTSTRYVSKDEALQELRSDLGGDVTLTDVLGENPLPASIRVTVSPARASGVELGELERKLALMPGVREIWSGREILQRLNRMTRTILILDFVVLVVVSCAVLFVVFQTVESSIVSRRHEIQIMDLVGADRAAVRLPFILEGTAQGLLGGMAAFAIVFILHRVVAVVVPIPGFPVGALAATNVGLGTLLGLSGSLMALGRIRNGVLGTEAHPPKRAR